MSIRPFVQHLYDQQIKELTACPEYIALENGSASSEEYDLFITNVIRAHMASPQFLAFLYSVAPPAAQERLKHNMFEELGLEEEDGESHPDLLRSLAKGVGVDNQLAELEFQAQENLRHGASTRLLFGTLKEIGLSAMIEVNAFEYMLSRISSHIAKALSTYRGLSAETLLWFTHHSEVDILHAEEGFTSIDDFVSYYDFSKEDAQTIVEMTLRENTFIKRYFGEYALGHAAGMLRHEA